MTPRFAENMTMRFKRFITTVTKPYCVFSSTVWSMIVTIRTGPAISLVETFPPAIIFKLSITVRIQYRTS